VKHRRLGSKKRKKARVKKTTKKGEKPKGRKGR